MKPTWEFAAALLAGGKSRRMGRDKAFVEVDGIPLWRRGLQILKNLSPSKLILSVNQNQDSLFETADAEGVVVTIDRDGQTDPLSALVQCLEIAEDLPLVLLAVDMPRMTADFLLQHLLDGAEPSVGRCFAAERLEPFAALYPQSILPVALEQVESGDLSLTNCIRQAQRRGLMEEIEVPANVRDQFANVNRPQDMRALDDGR